jgi:excinuclease ABC subunit C
MAITRTAPKKNLFVGPFINKKTVRTIFSFLQKTFQLYRCKKTIPNGCLHYHIGLCAGSCKPDFNEHDYIQRLNLAYHALTDNQEQFIAMITTQIQAFNKAHAFEKAARFTEYLNHAHQIINTINNACDDQDNTTKRGPFIKTDAMLGHSLQTLVGSKQPINSIDCFDISHFQGKDIVGSCIRFVNGIPEPHSFRHFKVTSIQLQNDYAALQEIVSRRYKEDPFPDLIVIDGGKGQLSSIKTIIPQAFVSSLAKREERLFCERFPEGIVLDKHSTAGLLLIAIRNYTHHFAIAYHRKLRKNIAK